MTANRNDMAPDTTALAEFTERFAKLQRVCIGLTEEPGADGWRDEIMGYSIDLDDAERDMILAALRAYRALPHAPIEHRKIADALCDIANDLSDDWKDEKRVMRQAVEALRSRQDTDQPTLTYARFATAEEFQKFVDGERAVGYRDGVEAEQRRALTSGKPT